MKKNLTKVMAMGMVLAMLGTATAFAEEKAVISETGNALEDVIAEAQEAAFISQSGKVVSVSEVDEKGMRVAEIDNEQGGLRFVVAADTIIVNRADGGYLTGADLTEGMEVAVIYGVNSPMGMSLPPYLGQVTAVVANADAGFFAVGHFDEELTDMKNMLKLNISEETNIQNLQGTKIKLSAEDVKNKDALVFYDVTTRSIPAQTNPSFVLILEEQAPAAEDEPVVKVKEAEEQEAVLIPLRETAEGKGYRVVWNKEERSVVVENYTAAQQESGKVKDTFSMSISVGKTTYVVDGDMVKEAALPAELQDGVMYVSSDIFA